jgi:thioredoxin reductase (NADPH)
MSMLLTTLGFFFVTGICVMVYLRRTQQMVPVAVAATGPPCPRCSVPVPATSRFCPGCGIPRQIYELVSTAAVAETGAAADGGGAAHAVVRTDQCVGCGTCVGSCPEPGALKVVGKISTVDRAKCTGHGKCAEVCPMGAIFMTKGAAVQRVEVPMVGTDFQSNVPGIYIVGELGGRGLIKNAINEGKIATENISRDLKREGPLDPAPEEIYDVIIVGSGPAGLSAGLESIRAGLKYVVLEQGSPADTIRKYPRHKILLAEPVAIPLYGDLWISDSSKETLLQVWETIIANTGISIVPGFQVENVERDGRWFRVSGPGRTLLSRRVILAMGRRGTPRRIGVPGEELPKVLYDVVEIDEFRGQKALVVGGGDSAVESALALSNVEGTEVTLSYRKDAFERVKDRNRSRLDEAIAAGRIRLLLKSQVREIRSGCVILEVEGQPRELVNDVVIARIGGHPPFQMLERIGVQMAKKDLALAAAEEPAVA